MSYVIGVDATRNRSGGAVAHIRGLFNYLDPTEFGVRKVHIWAYEELLDQIEDHPWLVKHCPYVTKQNIFKQIFWQRYSFKRELEENDCDLVFNTDAGSVCTFYPSVTMSQDLLSFEPGEIQRYFPSKTWVRLFLLKFIQINSLSKTQGRIYLTNYAKSVIERSTGLKHPSCVINHGISDNFRSLCVPKSGSALGRFKIIYISNADAYKHQWNVIAAVRILRDLGHDVVVEFVGMSGGNARHLVDEAIRTHDPSFEFVTITPFVANVEIPKLLSASDIFLFASSCENMPVTLIEGMASGLPVVCSDRGPMPEVLGHTGLYFDPENVSSIKHALYTMITDDRLRAELSVLSSAKASSYTWEKCSKETWKFIVDVLDEINNRI